MAPQLQINQGPQDALLFDNTRSYFTNVGYVRTSNFQMELRDVDPQNTANLGGTVNFVVPKAADLLGPVDLMVEFAQPIDSVSPGADNYWGWVESVGLAMIEKITFSVGSHDVETLTGDHLNIMNELMRSDSHRYGFNQILKTGRPLVRSEMKTDGVAFYHDDAEDYDTHDRIISFGNTHKEGKKLTVPLGLFFTTHPSKYFPLAAIAGCNDVRISIKFRTQNELLMAHGKYPNTTAGIIDKTQGAADAGLASLIFKGNSAFEKCYLRCHYIHVTGPEATALMNREHVRLMKLWHGNEVSKQFSIPCTQSGSDFNIDIDLSFLHPVQELVITIRKVSEMGSSISNNKAIGTSDKPADNTAQTKNYFAYHGGGRDPNIESWTNCVEELATSEVSRPTYLKTKSFQLKLNGQSRHLDGQGIGRDYLMNRLMPMLHSNTSDHYHRLADSSNAGATITSATEQNLTTDMRALAELVDRKEIYVYPFALNPEGANPSGSVNFSKVSHAKLTIAVTGFSPGVPGGSNQKVNDDYQVDVYGVYYNWLAIKEGRALTSFA